ncbi:acyl-CoA dehydrogenase family protein [Nonomuraea wenchangensis]|uniref:acyl-CoA dehydrogenase family protein n=1 Tax=Nonomuraea wenchangensis TaxID=568860 RepID=UPI003449B319
MDFALDKEQETLQEVVRDFLSAKSGEEAVRAYMEDPAGYDPALWRQMAGELSLQSLAIPEEYGGDGFTFVELGIVLEELGRSLAVTPFLASCVMAAQTLLALDDEEARREFLPRLARGDLIGTVAMAGEAGSWRPEDVATTARRDGDAWILDGTTSFVIDGAVADVLLVVARADDGLGVFTLTPDVDGVSRTPLDCMDQTRKQARVVFDGARARRLGTAAGAERAVTAMLQHTAIAVAAEALGGTAKVLDMAVEYAKTREQFGRPIGSFQAIKHKCATMLVELESSRSAVMYALWAVSAGHEDVPMVASLAKSFCVDAYLSAASENIQIHGGIGFTWEHPAHLYLKRAKNLQSFLGSSDQHRQLLADHLGV